MVGRPARPSDRRPDAGRSRPGSRDRRACPGGTGRSRRPAAARPPPAPVAPPRRRLDHRSSPAAPSAIAPGASRGGRGRHRRTGRSGCAAGTPVLEPDVQVVRFQGPPGLDRRSPRPRARSPCRSATAAGSSRSASGAAWDIACASRGIVERPLAELFPVIEIVGHLHRPDGIDPGKYPIRVVFNQDDLDDAVDRGRLVTKVIYLEDPDQAIPVPDGQGPGLGRHAQSDRAAAYGLPRPWAGRWRSCGSAAAGRPAKKFKGRIAGDIGLDWVESIGARPCPFLCQSGARCSLPCGPVCVPAPPAGSPVVAARRVSLRWRRPRRHPPPLRSIGRISGVEPRDAVVRFDIGVKGLTQARVLPTNVVCVYAPRFAEVRVSTGTNQNIDIQTTRTDKTIAKLVRADQLVESTSAGAKPGRRAGPSAARASGLKGRLMASEGSNARAASAYSGNTLAVLNRREADRRAVAQPAETGPGQRAAPPGRHQIGRGARHDRHRRRGERGGQGLGAARHDRRGNAPGSPRTGRHQARQRRRGRAGRHADLRDRLSQHGQHADPLGLDRR